MKIIMICFITYLIYDYIRDRKNEEKLAEVKAECGNQSALWSKLYEDIFETAKETIKAEAVKEFAERLNTALSEFDLSSVGLPDYDRGYEDCMTAVKDTFDNLVKEMEGES